MSIPTFYRGSASTLWIGLAASEALGLVGGVSRVTDFFGAPDRISLLLASGVRVSVPVSVQGSAGADLGGHVSMVLLVDGEIRIQGHVVDLFGNETVLNLPFVLATGDAPLNGAVTVAQSAPDKSLAFPAPGNAALVVLRPGTALVFGSERQALVPFLPVTPSVRF